MTDVVIFPTTITATGAIVLNDNWDSYSAFLNLENGDEISWSCSRDAGDQYGLTGVRGSGIVIDKTSNHIVVGHEYGIDLFHKSNLGEMKLKLVAKGRVHQPKVCVPTSYTGFVVGNGDDRPPYYIDWSIHHPATPSHLGYYIESGKYDYYAWRYGYSTSGSSKAMDPQTRTAEVNERILRAGTYNGTMTANVNSVFLSYCLYHCLLNSFQID